MSTNIRLAFAVPCVKHIADKGNYNKFARALSAYEPSLENEQNAALSSSSQRRKYNANTPKCATELGKPHKGDKNP